MVRMAWTGDPGATGLHGMVGHIMRPKGFWPAGGFLGGTWTGLQAAVHACGIAVPLHALQALLSGVQLF